MAQSAMASMRTCLGLHSDKAKLLLSLVTSGHHEGCEVVERTNRAHQLQ